MTIKQLFRLVRVASLLLALLCLAFAQAAAFWLPGVAEQMADNGLRIAVTLLLFACFPMLAVAPFRFAFVRRGYLARVAVLPLWVSGAIVATVMLVERYVGRLGAVASQGQGICGPDVNEGMGAIRCAVCKWMSWQGAALLYLLVLVVMSKPWQVASVLLKKRRRRQKMGLIQARVATG